MMDRTCVQLCVLRAGASLLTGHQMVAICCDWCGCLSGKDGAWTFGGFGHGFFRGKTCCGERESPKKFNRVSTTGVVGLSCTLGYLMVLQVSREEGRWLRRLLASAHPWRCGGGCRLGKCIRGHPWRCRWDDMGGKICVVVDGSQLEDILEVAEGLDGGFAHVGGHLIIWCSCKHPYCRNNPVFRSDRGICQIFVFEESCAQDAGCARGC